MVNPQFVLLRGPKDGGATTLYQRKGEINLFIKQADAQRARVATQCALQPSDVVIEPLLAYLDSTFVRIVLSNHDADDYEYSTNGSSYKNSLLIGFKNEIGLIYIRSKIDTSCITIVDGGHISPQNNKAATNQSCYPLALYSQISTNYTYYLPYSPPPGIADRTTSVIYLSYPYTNNDVQWFRNLTGTWETFSAHTGPTSNYIYTVPSGGQGSYQVSNACGDLSNIVQVTRLVVLPPNIEYGCNTNPAISGGAKITTRVKGGTGPYKYRLSKPGPASTPATFNYLPVYGPQDDSVFTNVPAGTYIIQVEDKESEKIPVWQGLNGYASSYSDFFVVNALSVSASVSANCGISTGILTAKATNGQPPYLFSIDAGSTYQSSNNFTLPAGQYTVVVKDASGCTASSSATVIINSSPTASITGDLNICPGRSTTLTASGGSSYRWSTGSITPGISVSTAGTYSVTVSTANGCSAVSSATVTMSNPLTTSITGNLSLCAGQSTTLTASGANADTYRWNTGATTAAIAVNATGPYSVTVSNGTCSATASASVTGSTTCQTSGTFVNCGGPQLIDNQGRIWQVDTYATPSGNLQTNTSIGTGSIVPGSNPTDAPDELFTTQRYASNQDFQVWTFPVINGNYVVNLYFAELYDGCTTAGCRLNKVYLEDSYIETVDINALAGYQRALRRSYSVTVTDGVLNFVVVGQNQTPVINGIAVVPAAAVPTLTASITASGGLSFCAGQSTTLTAVSNDPAATYRWNTGATTAAISVSATGTYSVTASRGNGATAVSSVNVVVNTVPTVSIAGNLSLCAGQVTTLTASGTNAGAYRWNTGETTAAISASTAGAYSVTATSGSCFTTASVTLNVAPAPAPLSVRNLTICAGQTATLSATGCSGTLAWANGSTLVGSTSTFTTPTLDQTTTYTVSCTLAGCGVQSATATVTVNKPPKPSVSATPLVFDRVPRSVTLTASGCEGMTTQWTGPTGTLTGSTVMTSLTALQTATFTARCVDAQGCQGEASTVTVQYQTLAAPIISPSKTTICGNETLTLTASNCDAGATVKWSNGLTGSPLSVTLASPTTYYATCTKDGLESDRSTVVSINVNPVPIISSHVNPVPVVNGTTHVLYAETLYLKATAPNNPSFSWLSQDGDVGTGANYSRIGMSPTNAGAYTVTARYSGGCVTSATVQVIVDGEATQIQTLPLSQSVVCAGSSLSVPFSTTGNFSGSNQFSVQLSDANGSFTTPMVIGSGSTSPIMVTIPASLSMGNGYRVRTISNSPTSNGTASPTVLTISSTPLLTITGNLSVCSGQSTNLTASGGTSYVWSNGATTASISVITPGRYSVSALAGGTCSANGSATVVSADRVGDVLTYPVPGLNYRYYQQGFTNNDVEGMTGVTPTAQGTVSQFDLNAKADHPNFYYGYEFTGYVQVTTPGQYTFFTDSDDGSKLWIGDQLVVDNNGAHASQTRSGQICLGVGYHAIRVRYVQVDGGASLVVSWQGPGFSQQAIPATQLYRNDCPSASIVGSMSLCGGQSTTLTASGGSTYRWNTGATTASISTTTAGTYSVTAVGSSGCRVSASTTVVSADRVADILTYPVPGLNYQYYQQGFANNDVEGMTGVTPTAQGTTTSFDINAKAGHPNDNYGYEYTGYVQVTKAGQYTFYTNSDDGSKLWIGNQQIVDNNGTHGSQTASGQICLGVGYHAIRVRYVQGINGANLSVSWQGPDFGQQIIPAERLFRNDCPSTNIGGSLTVCGGQSTTLTASGGTAYTWSTGATTASISTSDAGPYSVTIIGSSGCRVSASTTVVSADRVADGLSNPVSGLNYRYYQQGFTNNDVEGMTGVIPTAQGTTARFDINAKADHPIYYYGYEFTGYVQVTTPGQYTFYTNSDDGSKLWIGDQLVVDNNYAHAPQSRSGQICLGVGYHAIRVRYLQVDGGANLGVGWQGPDFSQQEIPTNRLFQTPSLTPAIIGNLSVCSGQSTTLTASGGRTYRWSTGEQSATVIVAPYSTRAYSVTVTDAFATTTAVASATVVVSEGTPTTITGKANLCAGESSTLTAGSAIRYIWSTGEITNSIVVTPTESTTYSVWSVSETGCLAQATKSVSVTSFTVTATSSIVLPRNGTTNQVQAPNTSNQDPGGNQSIASGQFVQLAATVENDQPDLMTYAWSGPNSFSSNQQYPSFSYQSEDQIGTYEVIASTSNGCAAGARIDVGTEPTCDLGVSDQNKTNLSGITTNEHVLVSYGCANGGQLTWSNGTAGIVSSDGKVTWADGETGQLANSLPFGDRAITINPERSKTYTAICQLPGNGKTCTYSVDVRVSSPACTGSFLIDAQINGSSKTTFEKGDLVMLSATGCSGTITWNNGLGEGNSIRFSPVTATIVSAVCTDGATVCYANPISLKIQSCIKSLYTHLTSGNDVFVGYQGCEAGKVNWRVVSGSLGQPNSITFVPGGNRFLYLPGITSSITVSATCTTSGNDAVSCSPATLTIPVPDVKCSGRFLSLTSPGVVSSPYAFTLQDESGNRVNTLPATTVTVPVSRKDQLFMATFDNACTASILVPATIPYLAVINWTEIQSQIRYAVGDNDKFHLISTKDAINLTSYKPYMDAYSRHDDSYSLDMDLVTSCPGTVVWTNDVNPAFKLQTQKLSFHNPAFTLFPASSSITYVPFPSAQTTYFANCHVVTNGVDEVFPASNPKTLVVNSDACMRIGVAPFSVTKGQAVSLTAVGCTGVVSWSAMGQQVGTGPILVHTPLPTTTPSAYTYTAACSIPACTQTVSVTVSPCQFSVTPAETKVKLAEAVVLSATGCGGGIVQWSTGETGTSITVKPLESAPYTATCLVNGVSTCQNSMSLTVDSPAPVDIDCPNFTLSSNTPVITRCVGQTVVIMPHNCPAGSTIAWSDGTFGGPEESHSFTLTQAVNLTATCTTPYQISVTQALSISAIDPTLQISPTDVYAGFPAILRASGCYTSNCQSGTYTWLSNGVVVGSGPSLEVKLFTPTSYTVKCNNANAGAVTQLVKLKQPVCDHSSVTTINPRTNSQQVEFNASFCDVSYPIIWSVQHGSNPLMEYDNGKDRNRIVVPRPLDQVVTVGGNSQTIGQVDSYFVNCVVQGQSVPCTFAAGGAESPSLIISPGNWAGGSSASPNTPDPCNEYIGKEKGGTKNIAQSPGDPDSAKPSYVLYADWCTSGRVVWQTPAGNQTLVAPAVLSLGQTSQLTYNYTCYLANGTPCPGTYTLPSAAQLSGGNNGGRLATTQAVSQSVSESCSSQISLATASGVFYSQMLCQLSNVIKTREDAIAVLTSLQSQLSATGLVFPNDLTAVINALLAGQCGQAGVLLAATNGNATIPTYDYNALVNGYYSAILNNILDGFKDYCVAAAPPVVMEEATPGGRLAAYTIDPNRLFIAPDGRPVRLPTGATPKFFNFGGSWGLPPAGTLQGFITANGITYFAEITNSPFRFLGYRRVKIPFCKEEYYETANPALYPGVGQGQLADVYYFQDYKTPAGGCGSYWLEGQYSFAPDAGHQPVTLTPPGANWPHTNATPFVRCVESSSYITQGSINFYQPTTTDLQSVEKTQLNALLTSINAKLGSFIGGQGSITVIDVDKMNEVALKREAQQKGVEEFIPKSGRLKYKNKYVLIFFGGGAGFTSCQYNFIKDRMDRLQKSAFFNFDYTGLTDWVSNFYQALPVDQQTIRHEIDKGIAPGGLTGIARSEFSQILLSTGAFYYYAALSPLDCAVAEEKFATSTNCGEAIAAGILHSTLENVDVVTLFVGASELVKATITSSAQIWLDYPANLRNFQSKLATNSEQVDGNDLAKVLPPPLQSGVNNVAAVGRVVSFMKKYYVEEASCWRTGDLIAQVAPILLTAGALTIPKLALWLNKATGRLGRLVNLFGSEAYAKKLVDDLVEYPELVTSSGRKVEQTILKDADGNIENICEEVEDATTHERKTIKICGACLAAQTPVFGTGQTLAQLSQAQRVQTLETDGSIAWRKVLGKISRRVSQYVSVWVKGERIDASADHAFKTSQGWQPAVALQKGTLLVSLATASLLPIDSVAFVTQPLVVEGLALGHVAGYGVGKWGMVVGPSRRCPRRVNATNEALDELENLLSSRYDEFIDLIDQLPKDKYALQKIDGKLKLIDNTGVIWVEEITSTQFKAKGGTNPWNQFLDVNPPLMKNFEYVVDGNFIYQTDGAGRVSKITIENLQTNQTRPRNTYQQQKAKDIKDGNITDSVDPTDDGGHMAAAQFNGPSEQINYFPQNAAQNRPRGDWYIMEQELKQLRADNPSAIIRLEIVPEFPSSTFRRPQRFDVEVFVNGNSTKTWDIPNP